MTEKRYSAMSALQQKQEYEIVNHDFEQLRAKGLKLDMSRGKPGKEQLNLVSGILTVLETPEDCMTEGIDARNYGGLTGLPCAKTLFAEILGCRPEECFIGGNASLNLMYDLIAKAYTHGLRHSEQPWSRLKQVKFLCPSPGYDRHFKISESFGMELIPIPMTQTGPDMDKVEQTIADPAVKGIWCVPKYSNPEGITYNAETVGRLAHLKAVAPDFTMIWDNAYCMHEFDGSYVPFPDILSLCRNAGNPDMVFEFASTSKITFPGAGVAVMAASVENIEYMTNLISCQSISYDKINQLRHVRYLKDKAHTLELMKKHAEILRPKFQTVLRILEQEIAPLDIAVWSHPTGGYFVSLDTEDGLARRTLSLCREAGVVMTSAGATYPGGIDPRDRNIRIAPSLPPVEELEEAMHVFCTCLRLAALEKLLGKC